MGRVPEALIVREEFAGEVAGARRVQAAGAGERAGDASNVTSTGTLVIAVT